MLRYENNFNKDLFKLSTCIPSECMSYFVKIIISDVDTLANVSWDGKILLYEIQIINIWSLSPY